MDGLERVWSGSCEGIGGEGGEEGSGREGRREEGANHNPAWRDTYMQSLIRSRTGWAKFMEWKYPVTIEITSPGSFKAAGAVEAAATL